MQDISSKTAHLHGKTVGVMITFEDRIFDCKIFPPTSEDHTKVGKYEPDDIEDLLIQEKQTKTVLTPSNLPVSDYAVNPYVGCLHACKYCYASFMKRFTGHTEDWGQFLDEKLWSDISNPHQYDGKSLFLSSVTDPYNQMEEVFQRTKTLLTQLQGSKCQITISTKSDLVLRDLDLIKTFDNPRVAWSIHPRRIIPPGYGQGC